METYAAQGPSIRHTVTSGGFRGFRRFSIRRKAPTVIGGIRVNASGWAFQARNLAAGPNAFVNRFVGARSTPRREPGRSRPLPPAY